MSTSCIENRQPSRATTSRSRAAGIVIYRIDETVTPSNAANADEDDPLVKVHRRPTASRRWRTASTAATLVTPTRARTGNHELDNTSTPNTKFDDGTPSNLDAPHRLEQPVRATMQRGRESRWASPPRRRLRRANDNFSDGRRRLRCARATSARTPKYATEEAGEPEPDGCGSASVWFRWTAPASGNVTMTTTTSNFDTVLGLYTGSAVNALTEVGGQRRRELPGRSPPARSRPTSPAVRRTRSLVTAALVPRVH